MSSSRPSGLVSLDDSLALLYASLGKLKAAKSIDIANGIEQLKMAAESGRIVREFVSSELPEASWQSREELDALIEKIQEILDARTLEQLRSRLKALATELERGSIVHRRARRVDELNQLRDQAINELRSQTRLQGAPPILPGPEADQWIEWACGLKEPQDAESLETLRNGFAHLDDFVANLEPDMWIAGGSPTLETPPEPERYTAARNQPLQSRPETKGLAEAVGSSRPNLATKIGTDVKGERIADVMLTENPPLSHLHELAASRETPAAQFGALVLTDALAIPIASLDGSLALLCESLGKLKAARAIDIAQVIEQFKMAAESARVVRELVWSELPQVTWENREELDALFDKIQGILDARALEQLRSRLLALATELERGHIVHRRAHRLSELNQLCDQAINELQSQAGLEGTPQTLPGPAADQWIEWACSLEEPQDAESLQALRNGFAHLDDFVANLEPNMWVAAGSPKLETPPEPEMSAAKSPPGQSQLERSGFEEPVVSSGPIPDELAAAKPSVGRYGQQFPDLLGELSLPSLESNTLTPNDVTPRRTEEDIQRIKEQEEALLASMMGLVSDPVGHFNAPVEYPPTAEVSRDTTNEPATLVSDSAGRFNAPVEHRPKAEVLRETTTAPAAASDIKTGVEEPWSSKLRRLLATRAVQLLVALLLFAVLGTILWKSRRSHASSPVIVSERKVPDLTQSNLEDKSQGQSGISTVSAIQTSSPITQTEKQSKPQNQSEAPKPLAKTSPPKQASERDNGVLRPPVAAPTNMAMVKKDEGPPHGTAGTLGTVPGALPNAAPNSVASIARDVPVAAPKVASNVPVAEPKNTAQKIRVSSGVAQGLLIHQVTPKYPSMARQARIQGTVVLQAVIGKDGTVQNLHVVSGHPLLTQAAVDAVRQWRYKPYYVNGEPVEADTQINVNFTLSGG